MENKKINGFSLKGIRMYTYDTIYRIWMCGGGEETIGIDANNNLIIAKSVSGDTIWDYGVEVNGIEYTIDSMQDMRTENGERVVPCNFAQLFAGEYDIIQAITDAIYERFFRNKING